MSSLPEIKDLCVILDGLVKTYKIPYMDAAIHYCEENGIEIETIAKAIKSNEKLRSKIQTEAEDLNFLTQKTSRIDL